MIARHGAPEKRLCTLRRFCLLLPARLEDLPRKASRCDSPTKKQNLTQHVAPEIPKSDRLFRSSDCLSAKFRCHAPARLLAAIFLKQVLPELLEGPSKNTARGRRRPVWPEPCSESQFTRT